MAVSNIKAAFESNIQEVWEIVTSLENYSWRSDLSKIEKINENEFIELYKLWEFDMENSNMKGHWTGVFSEKNGRTEIDFTEEVVAKKIIMKPFVKSYLKKQQKLYVADLKKAL